MLMHVAMVINNVDRSIIVSVSVNCILIFIYSRTHIRCQLQSYHYKLLNKIQHEFNYLHTENEMEGI